VNTGPMTPSECDVLLFMLDRLAAQDLNQVDRHHLGKIRHLGLYFLLLAKDEQHSVRVAREQRGDLRLVDEIEGELIP
jgi:hypothetical protein